MMILENYLNESTMGFDTVTVTKPEPLSEAFHISGDSNGLAILKADDQRFDNKVKKAMMFAESVIFTSQLKLETGNLSEEKKEILSNKIASLQENFVTDAVGKVVQGLKDAWQRMVTWFKNLFKSIAVAMVSVKKSLKDIEKILKPKEFKDFKHDAHDWNISGGRSLADGMGAEVKGECSTLTNTAKKNIEEMKKTDNSSFAHDNSDERSAHDKAYKDVDNSADIKTFIGKMVKGGSMTMEEAKDKIRVAYGYTDSSEKKGLEWAPMVEFLRNFENNKILTEAQKKCDELYSDAIKTAESALAAVNSKKGEVKSSADNVKNANAWYGQYARAVQANITKHKTFLNVYDTLMGECINMEKAVFSEYRGTIARAVRYSPKKITSIYN